MHINSLALVLVAMASGTLVYAEIDYTREVLPILTARCQPCHQPQALLSQGAKLVGMISGTKPAMPKSGAPLTEAQVKTISSWVAEGARPGDQWWSQRPLAKVTPPTAGHPLDSFIAAKLSEMKLSSSEQADRRTLIRRLIYDLHGLPPTLEQTESFLNDKSANAYEQLVDRLLASPRLTFRNNGIDRRLTDVHGHVIHELLS